MMLRRAGCANGASKMPAIVARATSDIQHRLWTLYWLARFTKKTGVIVELGVRGGDSTRALLAACEDSGARLYSYDCEPCFEKVRQNTFGIGLPWFGADWRFEQQFSVIAGHNWRAEGRPAADMVYVDTDHTLENTRAEIAAWVPHVRPGGCLAFHDYWLSEAPRNGVKPAADEFADSHADEWLLETHDAQYGDTGWAILWRRA